MVQTMKALLVLATVAAAAIGTARAQVVPTAKCEAAKVKCVVNKVKGDLGCEGKAAKSGVNVDSLCTAKVGAKFGDPIKGCMQKSDAKNATVPCLTLGDATPLGAKVDAFVADLKATYYTSPSPQAPNPCWAGQMKCVTNFVKGLLGCESKAVTKGVQADSLCLAKVTGKFTTPGVGCMQKLDAPGKACTSSGQPGVAATVATATQAFTTDVRAELMPNNAFVITTQPGVGTCGSVEDASSTLLLPLNCGDLAIGGGAAGVPPYPVPPGSLTQFSVLGTSGSNRTIGGAPASITGSNRNCSRAGCFFGSPLPIFNGPLSTCVDNVFTASASGTLNITAGSFAGDIPLSSTVTVTGNSTQPCPVCSAPTGGTCSADAVNAGAGCSQDSLTAQSHDCIAAGPVLVPFDVDLANMTTATASASDAGGIFCPSQANAGAFAQPTATEITEIGTPGGDLTAGPPQSMLLAAVFCIPATGNLLIDGSADLPGPGALALPISADLQ